MGLLSICVSLLSLQAERGGDPGAAEAVARKAALAAKADALRAKMRESHLANFRMEAKRRWERCFRPLRACVCAAR